MNVLIVEDSPDVSVFLEQACSEAGYSVQVVTNGADGLAKASTGFFDLILLDVLLPQMNGFEVCRQLRATGVKSLVLIITARDRLEDKIEGLDAGADDYICKPFRLPEILARMRALLRRRDSSSAPIHVGDLTLDPGTRRAVRAGHTIHLSATEYNLLELLMRHAGQTLSRSLIMEHVWQYDFNGRDNVLDVYIGYLRQKIDRGHTPLIHTTRGVGYRLGAPAPTPLSATSTRGGG